MLYPLPVANIHLQACHVAAEKLTPIASGHFCTDCQRTVHDFTDATSTDLAQARAAAPDGRVCGQFRLSQLAPESRPTVRLRPRLRQFLMALVLVLLQGFSARQAWAQVQWRTPLAAKGSERLSRYLPAATRWQEEIAQRAKEKEVAIFGMYVEQMPEPPGGVAGLHAFLQDNLKYPDSATASGKVFLNFIVQKTGQIAEVRLLRGLEPAIDAEALQVVKRMPPWKPGMQNSLPVDVSYTLPITFSREPAAVAPKRRSAKRQP